MVKIINEQYSNDIFKKNDLFICAIGYEHRSYYLLDKILNQVIPKNTLILVFDDYEKYPDTRNKISLLERNYRASFRFCTYQNYQDTMKIIYDFIVLKNENEINIHVDYSSMPRSWYSRIPQLLESLKEIKYKAFFWYVEGAYPSGYEEYPSAGIDSFSLFSGHSSLRIDNKRVHILSIGYDTIRTQAMVSILDPESMIVCNAYNSQNREISERVKYVNKELIAQTIMLVSLKLDDFSFMISKLCELAYEYQPMGDVIFIPDGPKPLILAMSLVPSIVLLPGVTCLHIARNKEYFNPIDVFPKNNIWGFSVMP